LVSTFFSPKTLTNKATNICSLTEPTSIPILPARDDSNSAIANSFGSLFFTFFIISSSVNIFLSLVISDINKHGFQPLKIPTEEFTEPHILCSKSDASDKARENKTT
jgi:hypothetical protein